MLIVIDGMSYAVYHELIENIHVLFHKGNLTTGGSSDLANDVIKEIESERKKVVQDHESCYYQISE